jgi:PAS domain S-box-containing protein
LLWVVLSFLLLNAARNWARMDLLYGFSFVLTVLSSLFLGYMLSKSSRLERIVAERSAALEIKNTELERELQERTRLQQELSQKSEQLSETVEQLRRDQNRSSDHLHFLRAMVDAMPTPFYYKEISGKYILGNQAFSERVYGVPRDQIIGRTVMDMVGIIPLEHAQIYQARDVQLLKTGGTQVFEAPVKCADGLIRQFQFSKAVIRSQSGEPAGIIGVMTDITEQKLAERALELSQQRLAEAMNLASLADWEYDVEKGKFIFDDRFFAQLGTSIEAQGGPEMDPPTYARKFLYPEDSYLVEKHLGDTISSPTGNFANQVEHRVIRSDGSTGWVVARWRVVRNAQGKVARIHGANQDQTARKTAEEDLRKLRKALDNSPVAVVVTDLCAKIEYVNPQFLRLSGHNYEEVIGKNPNILKSGYHSEAFYAEMWRVLTSGETWRGEICNQRKNGQRFWEAAAISPVRNDKGETTHYVAVKEDITARKIQAERLAAMQNALAQRESLLRTMTGVAPLAYLVVDNRTDQILYFNQMFIQIWRLQKWERLLTAGTARNGDIIPDCSALVADLEGFASTCKPLQNVENQAAIEDEIEFVDGRIVRWHSTQIRDETGKYYGRLHSFEDITRRKEADRRLEASVREKEILLREVYHRVKNNLQVITSLLSLQTGSITDEQTLGLIRETQERVRSMALVHEKLYRAKDLSRIEFDSYIQQLVSMLARSYMTDVQVALKFNTEKIMFSLDTAVPCGLILNELVSNALKYAFTRNSTYGAAPEIMVSLRSSGGGAYELVVEDNGVGLPATIDIYNTPTLGLQVVTMLADQLCGSVQVHCKKGSRFVVLFKEIRPAGPRESQPAPAGLSVKNCPSDDGTPVVT